MNIQEERTYILSENNTAQQHLNDILTTLNKTTVELNIDDELSGDIDFSVLHSLGFTKIRKINLGKGKITSINHIPKTVSQFNCSHNILIHLTLPNELVELNCSHNHISKLELIGIHHLKQLNCSNNELVELTPIPETIQEINCSHNHITSLDLNELPELRILHCSHNKLMIIQNLPIQLEDLKMDNNPMAEIQHIARSGKQHKKAKEDAEVKIDFLEALHEYFRLKANYTKKIHDMKKTAFTSTLNRKMGKLRAASIKPPCIHCKRNVGSIFSKVDDKYIAVCGDKDNPCSLNIQIYIGFYINNEKLLYINRELLDDSKEAIIKQKLNTLFNYMSEGQSAVLFKKELANYNEVSEFYKDYYDKYEQTYNNKHKQELIVRKNEEIYELLEAIQKITNEYTKTHNLELLKSTVQMQMDELVPKIEFLRRLKYEIMEMHEDKHEIMHLVQKEVALSNLDYTYSEPGHVIKYSK